MQVHMLRSGAVAESVLAITFSRNAAAEMKMRVNKELTSAVGDKIAIVTFHGNKPTHSQHCTVQYRIGVFIQKFTAVGWLDEDSMQVKD